MLTLEEAIEDLYRIAIADGKRTSRLRLRCLADLCVQELEKRYVKGVGKEIIVPGIGRDKQWDVAWSHGGKVRLGISLKSILGNIPGTVPNRADDLMGEMANVQLRSPEIVTGYVMVFDTQSGHRKDGKRWVDVFRSYVDQLDGRQAPAWAAGMVEAAAIVEVDFSEGPLLLTPTSLDDFFGRLVHQLRDRNPGAIPEKKQLIDFCNKKPPLPEKGSRQGRERGGLGVRARLTTRLSTAFTSCRPCSGRRPASTESPPAGR